MLGITLSWIRIQGFNLESIEDPSWARLLCHVSRPSQHPPFLTWILSGPYLDSKLFGMSCGKVSVGEWWGWRLQPTLCSSFVIWLIYDNENLQVFSRVWTLSGWWWCEDERLTFNMLLPRSWKKTWWWHYTTSTLATPHPFPMSSPRVVTVPGKGRLLEVFGKVLEGDILLLPPCGGVGGREHA